MPHFPDHSTRPSEKLVTCANHPRLSKCSLTSSARLCMPLAAFSGETRNPDALLDPREEGRGGGRTSLAPPFGDWRPHLQGYSPPRS